MYIIDRILCCQTKVLNSGVTDILGQMALCWQVLSYAL